MSLDLSVDDDVELAPSLRARLKRELSRMIRAAALSDGREDYEVSLRMVGDDAIRALNREYRQKDAPTDVLAFAQREAPGAPRHVLGDLVISVPTAKRQAKRGLYPELAMLASHGLCHLLGYDHRDDDEERVMNARMAKLRKQGERRGRVLAA
jgi:probable rRNA maturation factor